MAQQSTDDFDINAGTDSGTLLAEILNRFNASTGTSNSGTMAPTYALQGSWWLDTSLDPDSIALKYYNGTVWSEIVTIEADGTVITNVGDQLDSYMPILGGEFTGPVTSTVSATLGNQLITLDDAIAEFVSKSQGGTVADDIVMDNGTNYSPGFSFKDRIGDNSVQFSLNSNTFEIITQNLGVEILPITIDTITGNIHLNNGTEDSPKIRFIDPLNTPGYEDFAQLNVFEGEFRIVTKFGTDSFLYPFRINIDTGIAGFSFNPTITAPDADPTFDALVTRDYVDTAITDAVTGGGTLVLTNYGEGAQNLGNISGATTINILNGNVAYGTFIGAASITLTTTHENTSITILMTNALDNISWVTPILWEGGTEPVWTSGQDLATLTKIGSIWIGGALLGVA